MLAVSRAVAQLWIVRLTMIHGPKTPLEQRTTGNIISTIVAFILIGGFLITTTIISALRDGGVFSRVWYFGGATFTVMIVVGGVWRGIAELRRRRRHKARNQENEPSA